MKVPRPDIEPGVPVPAVQVCPVLCPSEAVDHAGAEQIPPGDARGLLDVLGW